MLFIKKVKPKKLAICYTIYWNINPLLIYKRKTITKKKNKINQNKNLERYLWFISSEY